MIFIYMNVSERKLHKLKLNPVQSITQGITLPMCVHFLYFE